MGCRGGRPALQSVGHTILEHVVPPSEPSWIHDDGVYAYNFDQPPFVAIAGRGKRGNIHCIR